MSKHNVKALQSTMSELSDPLTQMLKQGAQRLIERAVSIELEEYMRGLSAGKLPDGRQAVVRNGYLPERKIQTGLGPVKGEGKNPKDQKQRWSRSRLSIGIGATVC